MREGWKKENGEVIVEATLVFPIVFLIVFLMIYVGNAYFQKSKVEAVIAKMALYGAAQCADPMLKYIEDGEIPTSDMQYEIQPYRYLVGGMDNIEGDVANQINKKINDRGSGLFGQMEPKIKYLDVKFNNAYIYSTFSVEVQYKIPLPIRLFGMKENFSIEMSSRYDVPVSDTPEFIRNVDMVEDWVMSTETGQNIVNETQKIMSKVGEFIN